MAIETGNNELYFNTHVALKKLLQGATPADVFNHPKFPLSLPHLTSTDLRESRIISNADVKKAMIGVLEVTASADIAHTFIETTLPKSPEVLPYQRSDDTSLSHMASAFFYQFEHIVMPGFFKTLADYSVGHLPSPILTRATQAFGDLIIPEASAKESVTEKLIRNQNTPNTFVPEYSYMLRGLYWKSFGKLPTVDQLTGLIERSTSILAILAGRNIHFMHAATDILEKGMYPVAYNTDNFKLISHSDNQLVARIKGETRTKIEAEYQNREHLKNLPDPFVTNGCPTIGELLEVVVKKFASTVRTNAIDFKES